jgi:aryl-alcohol dehydrogenase-like predicted oxidoreductase
MQHRTIGSLSVSVIGLGTNNFGFTMDEADVAPVVDAALEAGINFFDTADSYLSSEVRLGAALGSRRDQIVVATKFGSKADEEFTGGAAGPYIRRAVERSLRMLGTDRIDLYQLHRPDPTVDIAETLSVLQELVAEGKVLEIGCSNFSAEQLRAAAVAAGAGPRFVSVQNEYSLLERADEAEVLPTCAELDIAYLPYFPLASGLLTGKYQRGAAVPSGSRIEKWNMAERVLTEENFAILDTLTTWAKDHGHSLLDLAFAWLLANPCVASVIAGATSPAQIAANAAAGSWVLSETDAAEVRTLVATS